MSIYDSLNKEQLEAVYHTKGPVLILAGAGSGKTRVLTHRIAYLIEEMGVNPYNILAITFTNKAAGEMRDRVDQLVGFGSESIWVSTFHATCVRILRRYIDRQGFDSRFTIYDMDDQKSLMKEVYKRLDMDPKVMPERSVRGAISSAKDELITPESFERDAQGDFFRKKIAAAYIEYQKMLKSNSALDFDDLIMKTVELLKACPDVLANYQHRFRYIMVDEYQDTNTAQFELIRLLADTEEKNLCVVGDDDQSIYKFRGANIGNILNFEKVYPDTKVIKLEQNYRSTQNILNAANEVIKNNIGRKKKTLWTAKEEGSQIAYHEFLTAYDEAESVIGDISSGIRLGEMRYKDCAILYRTNAQSRIFEEKLVAANIPYKLVGGVNFYARKEIKDMLAYLKTIDNARDDLAVRRIVNVPKRGIGLTTITRIQDYAVECDISFYEAMARAEEIPGIGRSVGKINSFVSMIQVLRSKIDLVPIMEVMQDILDETGYIDQLQGEDEEAQARIENIDELISKIVTYEEEADNPNLSEFLEEVTLVADIDNLDENVDRVILMTLHSAKGLEFPYVFLTGMEDGIFPSYMTITADDPLELEEERRLCYVGITRAMDKLALSNARQRIIRGETQYNKPSRFIKEIPIHFMEQGNTLPKRGKEILVSQAPKYAESVFRTKVFEKKQFEVKKIDKLTYTIGDSVQHMKFGQGIVLGILEGGKDYEITVDFNRVGVKKMFASFAKLKKISEVE